MAKKPTSSEDEFIAREEAKRRELAKIEQDHEERASAREARTGTCPGGCATKLQEEAFRDIMIDRCPTCAGVWLEPGELEKLRIDDAAVVRSFFDFFSGKGG